jgi:hypothetical protein
MGDRMKNNTLMFFDNPSEFLVFLHELDLYYEWRIQKGLLNDRGKSIENKNYVVRLRNLFDNRDFFRKKVSIAEIVSWLDTMSIMKRLMISLQQSTTKEQYTSMKIYIEYVIEMSKKMRIDYLLEYEDKILLLEFRTVSKFEKIRPTWQMKFHELLVYKELMSYYLTTKKIFVYSFVCMYEYDGSNLIIKQRQYNNNQIAFLTEYLKRYIFTKK